MKPGRVRDGTPRRKKRVTVDIIHVVVVISVVLAAQEGIHVVIVNPRKRGDTLREPVSARCT